MLSDAILFNFDQEYLTLSWNEPFACQSLDLKIIEKPYLYKNHSYQENIVLEMNKYTSGKSVDITDLHTCMSHRWEIFHQNKLLYFQDFKGNIELMPGKYLLKKLL